MMEEPSSSNMKSDFVEVNMEVHQVVSPPYMSTLQKLMTKLKETFFPDDPLRQFKGQPLNRRLILGAQYIFPILPCLSNYNFSLFKSDLIAGLTLASLAIPQGISYAKLASLPPIVGLYSSFVPPLVYVVLGSSRDIGLGPVSVTSLVLGSMLSDEVSPLTEPHLFLQLALTSTFFAGVFQAALGFLRLGFIIDFLSKATLIGFMAGTGVIVSFQQLKNILGIIHFTKQTALVPVLRSIFHNRDEWSWQTIVMGVCFLVLLLLARHISMRRPRLFWVSAGAPLLSVIVSTVLVFGIKGQNHGISVEAIAVGRTFATLKNYKLDGNKEMIALGCMNMVGSTTSCYVTTGAFSRSAVNHNAGGKTIMSNVVMSMAVMVTLLFLMPLFHYTPNVVLGAIIITAVIGLIDIPAACVIWKIDKFDFVVMMVAFFGVIFYSVQIGLAMAVCLSILRVLMQVTRPKTVLLGNIPESNIYRDLHHYEEATRVPGFLILGIEAPINFANITYLHDRILRWMDEEEDTMTGNSHLRFVVLEMSAVSSIDTSGVTLFKELKGTLKLKGIELVMVNPLAAVFEKLKRADATKDFIQPDHLFLTVGEAVASLSSAMKDQSSTREEEEHGIVTES
ncbi:probable sulfate transporter 3.3 isoform X2 [Lotus japonicus]|uniref:probable sulfate transporter 3.3 isoform X2 n=1 Tax=Lotus japonicus TaxID=34305 RepID=UPI0025880CF0|nr:probable sulfate transporter 3.3 isoform X2 [Lotus japonicus]